MKFSDLTYTFKCYKCGWTYMNDKEGMWERFHDNSERYTCTYCHFKIDPPAIELL